MSFYGNHGVHEVGSKAGSLTQGLSALGSMMGKKKDKGGVLDFGGDKFLNHALEQYEKELGIVKRWAVIPATDVKKSPAYQTFLQRKQDETGKTLGTIMDLGIKSAPGLYPYQLKNEVEGSLPMQELAKLCKELGVDAVAIIKMDFGYEMSFGMASIGGGAGTGKARASVATNLKVVTREGKFAVITDKWEDGKGKRYKSEDSTLLLAGNIAMNEKTENMFFDAIDKGSVALRERINREISE